ncbi:MAG: hypothetical protein KA152_18805, partial [Verrucomicrobiales bacterium]|nr:hypothetical protein [Verrucomicrobiales bacterium]
ADPAFAGDEATVKIAHLSRLRDLAQVSIDAAVKADEFKKRERAAVVFHLPTEDGARAVLAEAPEEALEFLMVSAISVEIGEGAAKASVVVTSHDECPRCRRSVSLQSASGLCERCEDVIGAISPVSS